MKSTLKKLNELKKGENLSENLPLFLNDIMEEYYNMSLIRLSLNYYMVYEGITENYYSDSSIITETVKKLAVYLDKYLSGKVSDEERQKDLCDINQLREQLIQDMNDTMEYISSFTIAEHALNRVEHRFDEVMVDVDDNVLIQSIMNYIFEDSDNVIVNEKIKLLMGQLPVRMTKSKLFNLISNSLTLYKGSDKASLDNFVDQIKSVAMLKKINTQNDDFDLKLTRLLEADYNSMDKSEYEQLEAMLEEGGTKLSRYSEDYVTITDIVNDCYEIMLTSGFESEPNECLDGCKTIIKTISDCITSDEYDDIINKLEEYITGTEGIQEKLQISIQQMEGILYFINDNYSDSEEIQSFKDVLKDANICSLLNSSSTFADLSMVDNQAKSELADEDYLNHVTDELVESLTIKLNGTKGHIKRAIMSEILLLLPLQFKNSNEVLEYVTNSVVSCKDKAEKAAFVEIFNDLT